MSLPVFDFIAVEIGLASEPVLFRIAQLRRWKWRFLDSKHVADGPRILARPVVCPCVTYNYIYTWAKISHFIIHQVLF